MAEMIFDKRYNILRPSEPSVFPKDAKEVVSVWDFIDYDNKDEVTWAKFLTRSENREFFLNNYTELFEEYDIILYCNFLFFYKVRNDIENALYWLSKVAFSFDNSHC